MSMLKMWKSKLSKTSQFLLIFILIFSWIFSGWPQIWQNPSFPPEVEDARAAVTRTIEQQINIIDQAYNCTGSGGECPSSGSSKPTDNSLGLINWDGTKYNGEAVYFEAVLYTTNGSFAANADLYTSGGTIVTGSNVSTTNTGYTRVRSGNIASNLVDGTDYTVRVWINTALGNSVYIKAARLIIVQSDATSITDTQTQVEIGDKDTTTSTSYATTTNEKIYLYTSGNWDPAPTVYFEASIKNDNISGSPTNTGVTNCGTTANVDNAGGNAFNGTGTPGNACGSDGSYSAVSVSGTTPTDYLKVTNLGFSGVSGTVTGIVATIEANSTQTQGQRADDYEVYIVKGDTIQTGGDNEAYNPNWTTSDETITYPNGGATNDLWGTSWQASDINDSGFGLAISAYEAGGKNVTFSVDNVTLRVYYTTASGVSTTSVQVWDASTNVAVSNSEIATTTTNWSLIRSGAITLTDGKKYVVALKTDNASATGRMANAKIILEQTDGTGIDKLETVHQYANTLATDADSTYTLQDFDNEFNPSNWAGGTFGYYFGATMRTSAGTGYAQLYNVSDSDAIDTSTNSEISTTNISYERQISANLSGNSDWPSVAKTLDTQVKNAASDTTSISSSWLACTVSGLAPQAPNAPTQDLPANSATDVSVTPNFKMTATDPDSDDLGYKVTIYSNSGCTTVVSTHDQSITSTGWASTDATCTASPTACYASGTQGDFTLQSGDALSNSTQYWWKASAKDPDGNGTFTDSATCNTFTTIAGGPVYSVSITSSGTIEYGFVELGVSTTTVGNGYTQDALHDGSGGPEKLNVKSSNATGGTTWTLGASPGSDIFKHEVSTTSGSTYMTMDTFDTYITASSSVAVSDTVNFDFRLTTPTDSTDFVQKSITITVQAVAP